MLHLYFWDATTERKPTTASFLKEVLQPPWNKARVYRNTIKVKLKINEPKGDKCLFSAGFEHLTSLCSCVNLSLTHSLCWGIEYNTAQWTGPKTSPFRGWPPPSGEGIRTQSRNVFSALSSYSSHSSLDLVKKGGTFSMNIFMEIPFSLCFPLKKYKIVSKCCLFYLFSTRSRAGQKTELILGGI